jgi:glutaminyl-peptide cyclotransferase
MSRLGRLTVWRLILVLCLGWGVSGCGGDEGDGAPLPAATPVVAVVTSEITPEPTATVSVLPTPTAPPQPEQVTASDRVTSPLPTPVAEIPVYGYRIIERYPHDPNAFTQGLIYVDGILYESTGLRGRSSLRRVDLESGNVEQMVRLPEQFFGEGITLWGDRLIQLTWRSQIGFVFDRESFELLETFNYETEGWGITHDETNLIISDGSNILYFLDPETFEVVRQLPVFAGEEPLFQLNELEYIDGLIYANIWHSDQIARIDPESGQVVAWLDLSTLFPKEERPDPRAVLNGIAYDADGDRLFVTGKLWPHLYWIAVSR